MTRDQIRDWLNRPETTVVLADVLKARAGKTDTPFDGKWMLDAEVALAALAEALPDFPDAPAGNKAREAQADRIADALWEAFPLGATSYDRLREVVAASLSSPQQEADAQAKAEWESNRDGALAEIGRLNREVDRLQRAVDKAHGALDASAYVGGPSQREAWQQAMAALGEVVTEHQAEAPAPASREEGTR